ncbi:MAG: DUF3298 domain-containing protein [Ginsengibacter sp.]
MPRFNTFIYLFFFSLITLLFSCNNRHNTSLGTNQKAWYKTFTGKIGEKEMVLHLSKADNYSGYLYDKETQFPIQVFSDPTMSVIDDSIYLNGGSPMLAFNLTGIIDTDITGEVIMETNGIADKPVSVTFRQDPDFTNFEFLVTKGNENLPAKLNNESTIEYFAATLWPAEKSNLLDSIKEHLKSLMRMPAKTVDVMKWLNSEKNSHLKTWQTEGEDLSLEDARIMGMSLSEQIYNRLNVMYENEESITLAYYEYAYTGGAHGNYGTTLINIDKRTGKKINLSDLLTTKEIDALPILLDQAARKQYVITDNSSLEENGFFVSEILPGENFYLTSKGIGFFYGPYELKPYSEGEINLFVPFEALKGFQK